MNLNQLCDKIDKVLVESNIIFSSGVLTNSVTKEDRREFLPEDSLRLGFSCPNQDCIGGGFSLNSEVENAIRNRKEIVEGSKKCCGKEDGKYRNKEKGCSCDTTLDYKIEIIYRGK